MEKLPHFTEVQRMKIIWPWIGIFITVCIIWYSAFQQLVLKQPVGHDPVPDGIMIAVFFLLGLALPILSVNIKLVTRVSDEGVFR